ncbi:MAG: ABC transporter permease [Candidatus Aegiribacteria sp.]|nr:ABC transporter permease [Candidatus Aegiribacteria sp.]
MNLRRVRSLISGDLRLGLRSPVILWLLIMPFAITFLLQVVFITLFDPEPRICIEAPADSEIAIALEKAEGIRLSRAGSPEELVESIENNNADLGLIIENGFDEAVRNDLKPELTFFFSGGSLASNRIVAGLLVMDILREMEGRESPLEVILQTGDEDEAIPISRKLIPAVVLIVLLITGIFVPAFMIVDEKEHGTMKALLVTPVKMSDILFSKAVLGFTMTIIMCFITLALNGALSGQPLALLATIVAGTVVCNAIGLIYGTLAGDAKTLYTLVKSLNILLAGPILFYLFTGLPQWIAKIFPTYWFIDPLYRITLEGADFSDVYFKLSIALVTGILLGILVVPLSRRMQKKLAE